MKRHTKGRIEYTEEKGKVLYIKYRWFKFISNITSVGFYLPYSTLGEWLNLFHKASHILNSMSEDSEAHLDRLVLIIEHYQGISEKYKLLFSEGKQSQADLLMSQFQLGVFEQQIETKENAGSEKRKYYNKAQMETKFKFEGLSPEYIFKQLDDMGPISLVLASGTLYPFDALESELGVEFPLTFRKCHVIRKLIHKFNN